MFIIRFLTWLNDLIFLSNKIKPQGFSFERSNFSFLLNLGPLILTIIAFYFILVLIDSKNFLVYHF